MTVSRLEREKGFLELVAVGDGESVSLQIDQQRDVFIIKELERNGLVVGTLLLSGEAEYRITGIGEERLAQITQKLASEELQVAGDRESYERNDVEQGRVTTPYWKPIAAAIVSFVGLLWLLASDVLAPEKYCQYLPKSANAWLAPCSELRVDS